MRFSLLKVYLGALCALASNGSEGMAQTPAHASFSLICAVTTPGQSFLEVDGKDLSPSGFAAGRTTGWIRIPAGKHSFRAEQQPGGNAELSLELSGGDSRVLLLYTEFVPSTKSGRPPEPQLRLLAIPQGASTDKAQPRLLKLYSLLPAALTLTTDQPDLTEVAVEPKKLKVVGFKGKVGFISLTEKAEPPAPEPLISVNFQEPSSFFILLYAAEEGKRKAISLEAP